MAEYPSFLWLTKFYYIKKNIYIYIRTYELVCVCVCVYVVDSWTMPGILLCILLPLFVLTLNTIAIWKIIEARYIGYCVQSHLTIKHGFPEIFARQSGTNSILGISFFLMATPVAHGRSWARDWIWATAVTYTTASAMIDPLTHYTGPWIELPPLQPEPPQSGS